MPKAYWIGARKTIKEPEKLRAYAELAGKAVSEYGGIYLARGPETQAFEGLDQTRAEINEFKDKESAVAYHNLETYQAALEKLDNGVERDLFAVESAE